MFKCSVLYEANYNAAENLVINQGGTSSGKTVAILQALNSIAISERCDILVVGQSIPNLKVGALKDQYDIIASSPELKMLITSENKTDRVFTFASGSTMQFKSFIDFQDAKSGKRDYTFFNEINGISKQIFDEVHLRTRKRTFVDYNPNERFYIHDYIGQPDVKFIRSWHEHNPFLSDKVRQKIENLKFEDEELWKVYARGLTGKIEGLIFRNWEVIDEIPKDAQYIGTGMDFGFTNDPTAVIDVYRYNGELIVDEALYERGLTNPDIYERIDKSKEYWADSAEPKSIEELRRMGLRVSAVDKGKDSIINSIDVLKRFRMKITRRSFNLVKELNSYKWKTNREGKIENIPVDFMNHGIDALRYLALMKLKTKGVTGVRIAR